MPHEIPNLISVAEAQETVPVAVVSLTTREEMEAYIIRESPRQAQEIIDTIACESDFLPTATGDHGMSHGLIQLHQPSHPKISIETAEDPKWALDYIISEFKASREEQWSCWRHLQK